MIEAFSHSRYDNNLATNNFSVVNENVFEGRIYSIDNNIGGGVMSFEYSATSMDAIHFVKSSLYSNDIVCPKYGRSLFLSTLFSLLINVRLKWNGACRFGSQPKYHQMSSIGHESISLRLELFPSATLEHTSLALLEILKQNYKESF